jgi:hypothetical protein
MDGKANKEVKATPSKSVPDIMKPRCIISTSHVRMKMKNVDVQLTITESTAANLTIGGRVAKNSSF